MNPNQILFATDFSARSRRAFEQSCRLAIDWNAKLNMLYISDPRDVVKPINKQIDPNKEFTKFIPEDIAIDFDQFVREGEPATGILEFADKIDATLIVLGTHGRTGLDRVFSGSVAEQVLRKAECPVMTIRDSEKHQSVDRMKRILVPVDFSVYGYAAVDFASRVATTTNAHVTIFYVDGSISPTSELPLTPESIKIGQKLWEQLQQFTPTNSRVDYSHKLVNGQPGEEICDYANSNSYDYIVLGTHGRSGLSRAIMGSVAEYVVRHAECPVISVKPSNKRSRRSLQLH